MEIQKVYVKTRAEFGKQCTFNMNVPNLDVNIMPNPADTEQYIRRKYCNVGVQHSKKYAVHKAQISCAPTKNSGMLHFEGGWPREINPRDEEATARFRRRVEKDEHWAPKLRYLFEVMQHNILQNGTVNIYDHYFNDMIPTELIQPVGLRTVNLYRDPETPKRPVTSISWSPDLGRRIVISYCFLQFGRKCDYSKTVYIWEVENSNEPYMGLEPFYPCATSEFNPRDPSVLVGGLINGQVCSWDTRASKQPIQSSHLQHSHRECANAVKWLPTKSNTEFFSTSLDGRAMWWDTRHLREPTDVLVIDLEQPNDPHMDRAIGVSCLNFGPMVGTNFMFGLDNGMILMGSRKARTNVEKLSVRLEAHYGRVNSVDRNFLNQSIFLSVGDWRAQVWAEDTREGSLVSTPFLNDYPTGGCWNKARHSAFYVTTASGQLLVWDMFQTLHRPVFTLQLCRQELTCLAPCEEGVFLTIGNIVGEVFLVEPTEFFLSFDKAERALLSEFTERHSKFAKAVDGRLREIKLVQKITEKEESIAARIKKTAKEKAKGKTTPKAKKKEKEARPSRVKDKKRFREEVPELIEAEKNYFEAVQKELEQYASETDPSVIPGPPQVAVTKKAERVRKPRKAEEKKGEESPRKSRMAMLTRVSTKVRIMDQDSTTESHQVSLKGILSRPSDLSLPEHPIAPPPSIEQGLTPKKHRKPQRLKLSFKLPEPCEGEVCKPKVCCWRGKGRRKDTPRTEKKETTTEPPAVSTEVLWASRKLQRQQSQLLKQAKAPPTVMREEVARAKTEIRIANARSRTTGRTTSQKQAMEKCPETKKKPVRRKKEVLRPKSDPVKLPEKSVQDSRKKETTLLGKERKRRVDPCKPTPSKTTEQQITATLNIPPLIIKEKKVKGRPFLDEYEQARKVVYPRISEFHLIN